MTTSPARSPARSVPRPLVLLLALGCAVAVANIYYAQPLLDTIARELDIGTGTAGLIITLTQLGYALGLMLLVPLGDLVDRRRLITIALLVTVTGLLLVAAAPSFVLLGAAIGIVGFTSVVVQVLVPFAATVAGDHERGRVVGHVMTGLLLGTLLSRTLAGLVAEVAGWRAMFLVAAALTAGLGVLLHRALPHRDPTTSQRYPQLLKSVWQLAAREPVLRRRSLYGALAFAAMNALWTPIAFLLARPPYRFGEAVIGAFALLTLPLAFTTGIAGRLADRGHDRPLTGGSFAVMLTGAVLAVAGTRQLWALALGAMLISLGSQSAHIANQREIYQLAPEARSRVTTVYMTAFFAGGVAGSALSTAAYDRFGWTGVGGLLAAIALAALGSWITERRRDRRTPAGPASRAAAAPTGPGRARAARPG